MPAWADRRNIHCILDERKTWNFHWKNGRTYICLILSLSSVAYPSQLEHTYLDYRFFMLYFHGIGWKMTTHRQKALSLELITNSWAKMNGRRRANGEDSWRKENERMKINIHTDTHTHTLEGPRIIIIMEVECGRYNHRTIEQWAQHIERVQSKNDRMKNVHYL